MGNVRVAAMLVDIENIEITSRVIRKAVGELEPVEQDQEHSFYGRELVQSRGQFISGILPSDWSKRQVEAEKLDKIPKAIWVQRSFARLEVAIA